MQPNHQKEVEELISRVYIKFVSRKDVFEPLSKILPDYWHNFLYSAIKKVIFKKVATNMKEKGKEFIWLFNYSNLNIPSLAKKVIEYEHGLKKMVYKKNDWGDPDYVKPIKPTIIVPKGLEYKYVSADGYVRLVSLMDFKRRYTHILRAAGIPDNVNDGLVEAIYKTIVDAFDTGHDQGVISAKFTRKVFNSDKIIDVFNNIELAASDLKKIIDES
jgi:hypothetical protein